jgi:two-component system sensor histidine kinase PhoQ
MKSLNSRITIGAGIVLAVFIAASAFTLERAFRDSARSARQERLLAQVYLLMAAAEVDTGGRLSMASELSEPRLNLPESGLYAQIVDGIGQVVWRSRSSLSVELPRIESLPAGRQRFDEVAGGDGDRLFLQTFGVRWRTGNESHPFTFGVGENLEPFHQQIRVYRRTLWTWLGAMAVLLLAAQWAILRWGLAPLRNVAEELARVEQGKQQQFTGNYPTEVRRLTDNLNTVLVHERAQQKRYRDALADLAHSLKTPLALIRAALREACSDPAVSRPLDEQIDRMDQIVAYHLQRAAVSGRSALALPQAVRPAAEKVLRALAKVHSAKQVDAELEVDAGLRFRGDPGDLTEMIGNVLDNAFKWCRGRVRVSAQVREGRLALAVEDDGPGIADGDVERLGTRGARADQSVPGHGIGLAVTRDIVEAYEGSFAITKSRWGGAKVTLTLPAAP